MYRENVGQWKIRLRQQTLPVHCCPREATQHSQVGEASLVQHNEHGQTNGNSQALLYPSKHHSKPGSIEHDPVKLVHLHMRGKTEQEQEQEAGQSQGTPPPSVLLPYEKAGPTGAIQSSCCASTA